MARRHCSLHDKPAYRLYDGEGVEIPYRKMLEGIESADVLLFGELHTNPIAHWLEFEITKDLFEVKESRLVLGAEMFETDIQHVIDEYLAGSITVEHFVKDARAWDNYATDYLPLVEFAKEHGLAFVATNIPRRYASLAAREGIAVLEGLPADLKRFIAPLPIDVDPSAPGYAEVSAMSAAHGVDAERFIAAQAIKDATMAYSISRSHVPGSIFIHYHGVVHSQHHGGIYWYLNRLSPLLRVLTITTVEGDTTDFLEEYKASGDYVVVVPETMTKTIRPPSR